MKTQYQSHEALQKEIDQMRKYIKSLEQEKQLLQEEKDQLAEAGQLAGSIAHDFKNVLAIILGSAQLLQVKMKKQPELFVDLLPRVEILIEQSKKGTIMARDILEQARPKQMTRD